jgi:CheY-like chemotaxis protein
MSVEATNPGSNDEKRELTARVTEQSRLGRFFQKLCDEALQHAASEIHFACGKENLTVTIHVGEKVVKSISLRTHWYDLLIRWLSERRDFRGTHAGMLADEIDFDALIRVTEGLCAVTVKGSKRLKGDRTITLHTPRRLAFKDLLEPLAMSKYARFSLDSILNHHNGLILVGGPDEEGATRSLAFFLSSMPSIALSWDELAANVREVQQLVQTDLILVKIRVADVTDLLLRLKELRTEPKALEFVGAFSQGYAKRVCSSCGREAVPEPALLATLPEYLKSIPNRRYFVGRGCPQCASTGYSGTIGLQGVLYHDETLGQILGGDFSISDVVSALYPRGLRSLLEDGIEKAFSGITTLESVFQVAKVVPESHMRAARELQASRISKNANKGVELIEVDDDFFLNKGELPRPELQSRKALMRGGDASGGGDKPLFGVTSLTRRKRERPLLLIAEDDKDQADILEMVFRSADYDVQRAGDGVEALKALKEEAPDLLITDLMMPHMDGLELVKAIKTNPALKQIPVLILTVIADSDKEYELLDVGADDYCEKTIQRKLLLKRVEKILKRSN